MAWNNPKKNWKAGDTPNSGDFNRIEENIDILGRLDRTSAYGVAIGTNAYAVTLDPAPLTYYEGMCIAVKIPNQNTGASTLNVNKLGAKSIRKQNGNTVSAGNLKAGIIYTMRYNGTNFILQGEGGEGTAQAGDVIVGKTFTNDSGTFTGTLKRHMAGQLTTNVSNYNVLSRKINIGFKPSQVIVNYYDVADSNWRIYDLKNPYFRDGNGGFVAIEEILSEGDLGAGYSRITFTSTGFTHGAYSVGAQSGVALGYYTAIE